MRKLGVLAVGVIGAAFIARGVIAFERGDPWIEGHVRGSPISMSPAGAIEMGALIVATAAGYAVFPLRKK
jgi:hypothetical protein